MNFNLSKEQAYYVKRLAALQREGFRDNFSTRTPTIHLFQQQMDEYREAEDLTEAVEYGEGARYEYKRYASDVYWKSFGCLEEVVADALDIDEDVMELLSDESRLRAFNEERLEYGEPAFIRLDKALADGNIEGSEVEVLACEDYLNAYGVYPNHVKAYVPVDGAWETMAISFTHEGAKQYGNTVMNHIFRPTRTYASTTQMYGNDAYNDAKALMLLLMDIGEMFLQKEREQYFELSNPQRKTKEALDVMLRKAKSKAEASYETIASVAVKVKEGLAYSGEYVMSIVVKGCMMKSHVGSDSWYPVYEASVCLAGNGEHWQTEYPFEADRLASVVDVEDSVFLKNMSHIFDYIRFKKMSREVLESDA